MSRCCVLNRFPVEIFYFLFDYFATHEIFHTFFNINNYIDSIIRSYPNHRLHLKSIRKSEFHLLCSHIQPEQVISLTLSDANDTPGLSRLFLSRFRIEQFTRLRSLTLIDIDIHSLKSILLDLHKIDHLQAFSLNEESIRNFFPPNVSSESFHFTDSCMQTLSQLNRLELHKATTVLSLSLSNLQHLKVARCSSIELDVIFRHATQLRSLSTCLYLPEQDFDILIPQNQLIELTLQITGKNDMG